MNKKNKFLKFKLLIIFLVYNLSTNNSELESDTNNQKDDETKKVEVFQKKAKRKTSKLEKTLKKKQKKESSKKYKLNFENAALKNVIDYISDLFDVTIFQDDAITDEKKQKGLADVKVTFKPNRTFTKKQVWDFFDLMLEIAGFARIKMPGQSDNFYRITQIPTSNKANLPVYVGTDVNQLPDYQRIRYIYFVQNRQASHIRDLIAKLQSRNAQVELFQDLNLLILTDSAYNIKTLVQLIQELDISGLPEILSILRLKNADAADVAKLYESLKGKEDIFRPYGEPKRPGPRLTESTKVIVEPRTNSLIIFGPKDSVIKFEEFVKTHIDKELEPEPSKIHVYELNYAPAEQIANILNETVKFGGESETAKFGGVRQGEKYLSRMHFEPEKQGNRLIIRGEPEDYAIVKEIIKELDVQQPQVAIEVFILTISLDKTKSWNSQIRNATCGDVNFQTSGFGLTPVSDGQTPQINSTTGSICQSLINLALSAASGSTLLTLGKQSIWGIFSILEQTIDAKIIANPFLVASNKYTASVSLGQTRKVQSGTIIASSTGPQDQFALDKADLTVAITPQINDFGIINLSIDVKIDNFVGTPEETVTTGQQVKRQVTTNANVADEEVLALGGLIRDTVRVNESGIPILSKIPLIGFLFKNKANEILKENLLIFMSPKIIRPHKGLVSKYTLNKADRVKATMNAIDSRANLRDPVHRWFFAEPINFENKIADRFLFPKEQTPGQKVLMEKKKAMEEEKEEDKEEIADKTDKQTDEELKDEEKANEEEKENKKNEEEEKRVQKNTPKKKILENDQLSGKLIKEELETINNKKKPRSLIDYIKS